MGYVPELLQKVSGAGSLCSLIGVKTVTPEEEVALWSDLIRYERIAIQESNERIAEWSQKLRRAAEKVVNANPMR